MNEDIELTTDLPRPPSANADGSVATSVPTRTLRIRCPHCHNPIQLTDDRSDEVLCPGCGSSFRIRDTQPTATVSGMRPLGRFQLLERVGLGAFGAVWRARDTELHRIVALKIPHTGLLTSKEELERFHREARAAAQLRHPNIVTVHEVVMLEGLPAIVADFVAETRQPQQGLRRPGPRGQIGLGLSSHITVVLSMSFPCYWHPKISC